MSEPVLTTRPPNAWENSLRTHFADQVAGQSELMDALAGKLITLELAVPAIYATALKLVQGDKATVSPSPWLTIAFIVWSLALIFTLFSLIPRDWKVDPALLDDDPNGVQQPSGAISITRYFRRSATYKRNLIITAVICFWIGTLCAVLTVVQ